MLATVVSMFRQVSIFFASFVLAFFLVSEYVFCNEVIEGGPVSEVVRAKVVNIVEEYEEDIPGTETKHHVQILQAELKEGTRKGEVVEVRNDYFAIKDGDTFFLIHEEEYGQLPRYYFQDIDRRVSVAVFSVIGIAAVVALGSWYGVRAVLSLLFSLLMLWHVLIPGLVKGWDPLMACFLVASAILACVLVMTHGFKRETFIALSGTLLAVFITLVVAKIVVHMSYISGFSMEGGVSLNFSMHGSMDLVGLLIGSIVIGTLGVLDDIAITQVAVVREIKESAPSMHARNVFFRAMRVGREHIGAVVNTLALAYVGVSLPMILLSYMSNVEMGTFLNMEVVAVEILRTVVGTIGIVMTVPLVTAIAVRYAQAGGGGVDHSHT